MINYSPVRCILAASVLVLTLRAAPEDPIVLSIPMRDGISLEANLFRPDGGGKLPTLLIRTPYNKRSYLIGSYRVFLNAGFNLVVQDVRGRYGSAGRFQPLEQEGPDGEDTLNWIARQPWSDGRVGMLGGSYLGIAQWKAALTRNPHLAAIFPGVAGCDEYLDRFYSPGGALKLGHRMLWIAENLRAPGYVRPEFGRYILHLPLRTLDRAATGRTVDFFQEALNHPVYDSFWRARSTCASIERARTPAFLQTGWYDNFAPSDLEAFARLSSHGIPARLVVGPWGHSMSAPFPSGIDFGPESGAPIRKYQLDWFRQWLRPTPDDPTGPPVRLFVMGANKWRDENEWPLARTRYTPLYLSSRGGANTLKGDGLLVSSPARASTADHYVYDPRKPVLTAGGPVCCNPKVFPWGPMDQRETESRQDVLVYTGQPLREALEATGPVRAVLNVATSARDTDFTAKLVDVHPDGHARNLTDGILRLRYRKSLQRAELSAPGQIYEITIDMGVTSHVFLAGHRIRLEISSSNFPRYDRNLNTGGSIADGTEIRTARQTVYHGRPHLSYLLLPVIP